LKELLKRRSKLELQDVKKEIEALKGELGRLIDLEANFREIYKISVELDKLIVAFYKKSLRESI
jgi:hypothetical protein